MKQKLDKIIILINILILLLLCCNYNNIVYAESPGAFSSALHDENHPETQIIEGEVIDTGAVNSNGDKSLEKVEQGIDDVIPPEAVFGLLFLRFVYIFFPSFF